MTGLIFFSIYRYIYYPLSSALAFSDQNEQYFNYMVYYWRISEIPWKTTKQLDVTDKRYMEYTLSWSKIVLTTLVLLSITRQWPYHYVYSAIVIVWWDINTKIECIMNEGITRLYFKTNDEIYLMIVDVCL